MHWRLLCSRIIARPFIGELGSFVRTSNRHDYSRMPEKKMVQQELQDAGVPTVAVGKIGDIYAHVGWDESILPNLMLMA